MTSETFTTFTRMTVTPEGWHCVEVVEPEMGFNKSDYVLRTIYVPAAIFDTWDMQDGETGYLMNEARTYVRVE